MRGGGARTDSIIYSYIQFGTLLGCLYRVRRIGILESSCEVPSTMVFQNPERSSAVPRHFRLRVMRDRPIGIGLCFAVKSDQRTMRGSIDLERS